MSPDRAMELIDAELADLAQQLERPRDLLQFNSSRADQAILAAEGRFWPS